MASIIYNSALRDEAAGAIDFDTDSFKVMLLSSSYTPAKSHAKRSDLTNEVTGSGYSSGGVAATITVGSTNNTDNRVDITLGGVTFSAVSVTARYAAYYKSRGGASSADELVALIDFGTDIVRSAADLVLNSSTLRKQN